MSYVNRLAKEVSFKIVYYGPGLSGKTTNLEHIYGKTAEAAKGKMVQLETESERTLFFDFLPVDLGRVKGYTVRFHLYSVPGQVFYDASRQLVLQGADGVVFVADSQPAREQANVESLENFRDNMRHLGLTEADLGYVIQFNKRDAPEVMPVEQMVATLNPQGAPQFMASAIKGEGVYDTLKGLARQVLPKVAAQMS